MQPQLVRKVKELILEYYDDFEKPARLYTLLAFISFVLDIISFFAVFALLVSFINSASFDLGSAPVPVIDAYLTLATPYLGRIIVIMLYTMCDVLYIFWIIHFRSRMGETERGYVLKALLGFGDAMRIAFGQNPKGGRAAAATGANP